MPFNHYAKLRRIIEKLEPGWFILRIDEPTTAQNFKGEVITFPHYYRICDSSGEKVKYGKFQQLERLASILDVPEGALPVRRQ